MSAPGAVRDSGMGHEGHRELPGTAGLRLAIRGRARRDIGAVILAADSAELIAGVQVETGIIWPDDRGFFTELFRFGGAEAAGATQQVSAALSFPGTIKAFHYHCHQTDRWAALRGGLQVVLYDLRVDSPSFGRMNTMYVGEWRPWRLRIPPGVAHGYKVLGTEPAVMVYATDRFYDPADEGRIPYNDAGMNYDWELQHK